MTTTTGSRSRARKSKPPLLDVQGPDPRERERIHRAFLAMALSHELKQPLNTLNLNAELLSKRLHKIPDAMTEVSGPLAALGRVVDRVTHTLEAFYDRVMPDPVPGARVPVQPLLEAALERNTVLARGRGVKLRLDVDPATPDLSLHAGQIAVALDNLLRNAIEVSSSGDEVILRARSGDEDVRIEVTDVGAGMTPDVARRAVEIGFTTHTPSDGCGLTVAKFIAYHHCGGFHVDTRSGQGTVASMVLPVLADDVAVGELVDDD